MGETVEFPAGDHVGRGYLATPTAPGGPGVLVIQEWWGLVPHIRSVCDRFAGAGFTALAPDLYDGRTTREPDEAKKEAMNLVLEDAGRELAGAAAHLFDSPLATGHTIGVVGFCMGGGLALHIASRQPEIAACVTYYGVGPARNGLDVSGMKAAVLGHWGEKDGSYDHATIDALAERLREGSVDVEFHWYDADHAFFNDDRPEVFDEAAARLSWDRTVTFFRDRLRS